MFYGYAPSLLEDKYVITRACVITYKSSVIGQFGSNSETPLRAYCIFCIPVETSFVFPFLFCSGSQYGGENDISLSAVFGLD